MKRFFAILSAIFLIAGVCYTYAQDTTADRHQFTITHSIETTPVENQGRSGTCWAFATTSFLETELIRKCKGIFDLSEMFSVYQIYNFKANKYLRLHGNSNFGQGGQAHDVLYVIDTFGMVPKTEFNAKIVDTSVYNHSEMELMLRSILDNALKRKSGKLTKQASELFDKALEVYLGKLPDKFTFEGKEYTPKTFAEFLDINGDDYIELTSFTNYPFNEFINLEIPDNFAGAHYYNIPIDILIKQIDYAIENGFSVCWDGDAGSEHFNRSTGYAVVPKDEKNDLYVDDLGEEISYPEEEIDVTQEIRQEAFDDFSVTDDHLMHLVGLAENQAGTKFYYTKNSWGTKDKKYDGYWYMSEPYVRLKTIAIMIHKDALLPELKSKL
ncbi:MAG: aminopeptidase [Melioribacteraceae bacterium]|nr:aminopeptidase [Melioribacteraceae bacterium]